MIRKLLTRSTSSYASLAIPWLRGSGTYSNYNVSESSTLAIPGFWRGITLIADAIAGLPLQGIENNAKLDPTPLLLEQPCPTEPRFDTLSSIVLALMLHGNYVAVLGGYDELAYPSLLMPVNPLDVSFVQEGGRWRYRIGMATFDAAEVLHIAGPRLPGTPVGLGVVQQHMQEIGHVGALYRYAQRWFGESSIPSGVVQLDKEATDEQVKEIKQQWIANYSNSNAPAVLAKGMSFTPMTLDPKISQFVETKAQSLTDIANIVGLPGHYLGAPVTGMTYSNAEQERKALLDFSFERWLRRIEDGFSALLPPGQKARFNRNAFLRTDTTTRYAAHEKAIAIGLYDVAHAQALEDTHE